jgi:hypothetical protein
MVPHSTYSVNVEQKKGVENRIDILEERAQVIFLIKQFLKNFPIVFNSALVKFANSKGSLKEKKKLRTTHGGSVL